MKSILFLFVALSTLMLAQGEPPAPALRLEGTANQLSPNFITSAPWQVQVERGEGLSLYLYDATTRKTLRKLSNGDTLQETGTFFIYVVAPDNTPWQVVIEASGSADVSPAQQPEATPNPDSSSQRTSAELPPINKRTEKNWGRHFGFEVSRFTRAPSAAPGNCSVYPNALEAQAVFIEAGGPDLDPNNLDTDGDGYACSYNPFDQSYLAAITCETGKQWINPRYRRNGTYNPGGCRSIKTE
jgi:hypothetical protein